MNTARAVQTQAKEMSREGDTGSWYTAAPSRKVRLGVRYWRKPTVLNGSRRAACENQSRGTAVTTPPPTR